MLEQAGVGQERITGALPRPLGRGEKFESRRGLRRAGVADSCATRRDRYDVGEEEVSEDRSLVRDPDGHFVWFHRNDHWFVLRLNEKAPHVADKIATALIR
jgi:hypothetical protein